MVIGLLAKKIGMSQIFLKDGSRTAITVVQIEPNFIVCKKTFENDGYTALQIGTGEIRSFLVNKAMKGKFKNANISCKRYLREFRVTQSELDKYSIGDKLNTDWLLNVQSVDVVGLSKGKGFAGVMKRHNFSGFPASHGTHEYFRHGGSIGMRSKPGKVFKGKRMPGRMGGEIKYIYNLRIIKLLDNDLVLVRGAIPGKKKGLIKLYPSFRKPNSLPGEIISQGSELSKNPMKASKTASKAKPASKK